MNYNDSNYNRLLNAFNLKVSDRVPILEFWPQSQKIIEYIIERSLGYEIESAAEGETSSLKIKDALEFAQRIGMDAIGADFVWWPGQVFKYSKDGAKHYVDGRIKGWEDIELLEKPDDVYKQLEIFENYLEVSKDTGIGIYPRLNAFFNPVYLATGITRFAYLLYDDLKFIEYLLDLFLEQQLKTMSIVCNNKNVKFIQIDDDIAFGSGLFVKKEKFLELYFDRMKRLLKPAKDNNILIAYHTDGNLDEILPIFIKLGINALHPIEPMSNDIYKIKDKYGDKICLCGNIDLVLLTNGTKQNIREDVIKHLDYLGKNGGYVCGTSSSLYDGIPPENYAELVKTVHECGYY
jgi:hypothetical protein